VIVVFQTRTITGFFPSDLKSTEVPEDTAKIHGTPQLRWSTEALSKLLAYQNHIRNCVL